MITIYHSPLSRSLRVIWLCEELGIPYQTSALTMFADEMKDPAYLAIHPLGKVPAIDDDGFILWETIAIFYHLVSQYSDGAFIPDPGTEAGARAMQWMTYGESSITVIMGEIAAHSGPMPEAQRIPALVDRGREIAPSLVQIVERALSGSPYILGDKFAAADIMLGYGLTIAQYLGYVDDDTPQVSDYCARLTTRPAYIAALNI